MPRAPDSLRLDAANPALSLQCWSWGGDDPPLLLLHGFGMSARVWDPIVHALAPRRVLAPDARGHGDSDRDPERRDPHETGHRDLAALVDALGLPRFALVGHSMGAATAMRYAARHPERIERLVLVDAGPDMPLAASARRPRPEPRRRPPITGFESEQAYANALGVFHPRAAPERLLELAHHWLRRRPDGRFEPKLDPALLRPKRGDGSFDLAAWGRAESERLWEQLAGICCSTLIVRAEHSSVLSGSEARRMLGVLADGHLTEVSASGHAVMLDAAQNLAAVLGDFLR